ncbi:serine/threonine-protein phosphatase 7 long form homolog isoform X3 [Quercus robur]|uniref:serine/threonine-protein phosphatase 7 long form homolog isoform X3 n=1 Tax=Quercus robur TaxID=38942 RepID=UPI002163247F|nr:serine/threonine-protein phosphatase 7 long form homolog isoform X3 [Quercus robur]
MEPRIDEELKILHLGLLQRSLLTRQPYHRSEAIWNGEEPGPLMCRSRTKEMANVQMQDNRVIDIIKLLRLEGLFRVTSREIDHCLITALVERSRPETHTFHLPHGEMSIILQDVEVIFGLPIDGEVLVGLTTVEDGDWSQVCGELLGFTPPNDNKTLVGQRILISRLVEAIATPLPHDATEIQIHQYARCYILALVEDKLFMDKSGDRVHLMFLDFMRNLRDPRQYSWGSGCLAWLYRELCRASEKGASQIGGACTLVQYWAWVRLPFLCSRIEPPLGCDYGLWPYAPLAFKWVRVPSSKSRPSNMALVHYREQLVTMQLDQPYEADFGYLLEFCVVGRDTWTARVPLVCFCIVERHHPDRVLRQFGLAQQQPDDVVYDDRLHKIDLHGKVKKNWREEHGLYIISWEMRRQQVCHAPPQIDSKPFVLLEMLPEGSQAHNHVRRVLNNVAGLGGGPVANGQANNGHETEPTATATPSTSTAPVSTRTRGQRAIASPSPSTSTSVARGRGRPATTSPSTSAARGRGMPATASPITSAAKGCGRRATTLWVVSSPEMPAPIPHSSPQPEVLPPIPDASL